MIQEKTHHKRRKPVSVDRLALRDRHRAEGPPVVRALHRDEVLLARDAARHLERSFDRLGARTREEERVERRVWHKGEQPFDEAQVGLVVGDTALSHHHSG